MTKKEIKYYGQVHATNMDVQNYDNIITSLESFKGTKFELFLMVESSSQTSWNLESF